MAKQKVTKSSLPLVLDEKGEPIAVVVFNENRDRVIYLLEKAGEDDIIKLLEHDEV
jgi:hypothetical protein